MKSGMVEIRATPDRILKVPRCLDCDYQLTGLQENRCPECGRVFDPADPTTINSSGRIPGPIARWLMTPVGWPLNLLAAGTLLFGIWGIRKPGDWGTQFGAALLWMLIMGIWFVRLCARVVASGNYERVVAPAWKRVIVAPLLLLIWMAIPRELPQQIAFDWSRESLEALANQAMSAPASVAGMHTAGVYQVSIDGVFQDGVLIYTGPGYDGARCGFAYFPTTAPTDGTDIWYDHIDGNFYEYRHHAWPSRLPTTWPAHPKSLIRMNDF